MKTKTKPVAIFNTAETELIVKALIAYDGKPGEPSAKQLAFEISNSLKKAGNDLTQMGQNMEHSFYTKPKAPACIPSKDDFGGPS